MKPGIKTEEKILLMEDWYYEKKRDYSKFKFKVPLIIKALNNSKTMVRHKVFDFIKKCKKEDLHLLIVSGGLSDVIATILS